MARRFQLVHAAQQLVCGGNGPAWQMGNARTAMTSGADPERPTAFGLAHLPMQTGCRRRRAAALHARAEILRAMINGHTTGNISIMRRSLRSGNAPRRWSADLSASRRPVAPFAVLEVTRAAPRHLDGRSNRLARAGLYSARVDRFPRASSGWALGETLPFLLWRWIARRPDSMQSSWQSAVAIHQGTHRGDDLGMLLAEPLHCTIAALATSA